MARTPMTKSDLPRDEKVEFAKALNKGRLQGEQLKQKLSGRKFDELSSDEKDSLFKAMALALGFVDPD